MNKFNFKTIFYILLPLIFLGIFLFTFLKYGPIGVFKTSVAPIEDALIQKVVFTPENITFQVYNNGPETVTIAQVLINDAYWKFEMTPDTTLEPLERATVSIFYPWLPGDPQIISLLSQNGVLFQKEIEAAVITPQPNRDYVQAFVLLGLYVGVIPVLLGLMWLPFLRKLRGKWYDALIALTTGLLIFLGIDAVAESLELVGEVPSSLNGVGIFAIGFFLAVLALSAVSYKTRHLSTEREGHSKALMWGYLIALGIGLHNLGEGLAIGSAYAIGEVALGSSLVIGFMLHNITEGVAIIAPLTQTIKRIKDDLHHIICMGLLAGLPTILGSVIGGFAYTNEFALLFLAIGAGAIFEVTYDILKGTARGSWASLFTVTNVIAFLAGLVLMYLTGYLVVG